MRLEARRDQGGGRVHWSVVPSTPKARCVRSGNSASYAASRSGTSPAGGGCSEQEEAAPVEVRVGLRAYDEMVAAVVDLGAAELE